MFSAEDLDRMSTRAWLSRQLLVALLLGSSAATAASWEPGPDVVDQYNMGKLALEARNPAAAESDFRAVLAAQPGCGMASQGLAYAMLFQNRSREAKSLLQQTASAFPDNPSIHTSLSEASFAAQDFALAREAAQDAIRLDPASLDAEMALQAVYLRLGEYKAAGAALDEAELHLPGPELACLETQLKLEEGDLNTARDLLKECKRAGREDLVTTVEGLIAQASGRKAEASQLMSALGVDTVSQVMSAATLYDSGKPAEAVKILDDVLKKNPERIDARIIRGQARAALGDKKGARQDLETAFQGDTWVEVHDTGMMSGILRKSDEDKLAVMIAEGAAMLVRLLADEGELARSRAVLTEARKLPIQGAAVDAAEAWLLAAEGRTTDSWKVLSKALLAGDNDPILRETAGQLTHRSLSTAPPVVLASIRAQGPASARYNLASALFNNGRSADCLAEVIATPPAERISLDATTLKRFDQLGYRCAVAAEDLTSAEGRLKALGLKPGEKIDGELFSTAFNHALLLSKRGDVDGTVAVLALISAPDKRSQQKLVSLAVSTLGEGGRLDEALVAAADPVADPQDLAWLAGAMANAERVSDATLLLNRACPMLSGDAGKECKALQAQLKQP